MLLPLKWFKYSLLSSEPYQHSSEAYCHQRRISFSCAASERAVATQGRLQTTLLSTSPLTTTAATRCHASTLYRAKIKLQDPSPRPTCFYDLHGANSRHTKSWPTLITRSQLTKAGKKGEPGREKWLQRLTSIGILSLVLRCSMWRTLMWASSLSRAKSS